MEYSTLPRLRAPLQVVVATVIAFSFTLAACSQAPAPATSAAIPDAAPAAASPAVPAAEPAAPAAEVPAAAKPAAPAPKPAARKVAAVKTSKPQASTSAADPEATAAPARQPITVCTSCGVISAITPVKTDGKGTAIGVVAGGIAGLIVGNQIGSGKGKTIAKVAGAAGGAYVGNKIEKKVRAETSYEVKIRLDDGTETTVTQDTEPKLAVGAAVRIVDGTVVAK